MHTETPISRRPVHQTRLDPTGRDSLDLTRQTERHWPAFLALGFDRPAMQTRMHHMAFKGPLRVQRPFYPEGDVCHVYLLHPPGGLVSGDDLQIEITCQPDSHVLVTTPSAGKIYQADRKGIAQKQRVRIQVDGGVCEWLPMETIVFNGAHGELRTEIHLSGDARFVGLEVFCLGRPKSQQPFVSGSVAQHFFLYQAGVPVFLERQMVAADDPVLHAMTGFNGHRVSGLMVIAGLEDPATVVEALRVHVSSTVPPTCVSVTWRMDVVVVRYLGDCSAQAQHLLRACWAFVRPTLLGRAACVPRIWNT